MTGITVRLATSDDDRDVCALAGLRFQWRHDEGGEVGDLAAFTPAFARWWREHADARLAFLAERPERAVGMAWLGIIDRTPGPEHFVRRSGMVQSAYVVPGDRGKGVGTALLAAVIATARERGLDYLMVHPSERSYPLYERAGFAETSAVLELGLTRPRHPRPPLGKNARRD